MSNERSLYNEEVNQPYLQLYQEYQKVKVDLPAQRAKRDFKAKRIPELQKLVTEQQRRLHQMEVEVQRDQLQHQMILLSVATTATFAMFILTVIPFVTLVTFSLLATSAGLLSYTAFQRLVLEYQEMIASEGFARFLPASMISLLTNQSLHQFLRDDTFVRE